MRRRLAFAAMVSVVPSAPVVAQESPFPSSAPRESAEAHGRTFGALDEIPPLPLEIRSGAVTMEGSAERVCVDVPLRRGVILRSGEMIIGGTLGYPIAKGRMKVWWRPLKSSEGMTLTVVGQKIGTDDEFIRYRTNGPVLSNAPGHRRPEDLFFPGVMEFLSPGSWVVIGTTGSTQWGCFVFDIPEWGRSSGV